MYVDGIDWFQYKILIRFYSLLLFVRLILIVESARPILQPADNPVCSRLQAMLSYGKYQTSQMPSNISYTSRYYGLNFLAYSPIDDLLIFIEPKYKIHIYNGQSIRLITNVNTTDVVIATSCPSLLSESQHELFFIHETNTDTNLISLRVCEVQFDRASLEFEENLCIGTIEIQYDQPDLRINGFTIKRNHAGSNKSLLFISTDVGVIYSVFETQTGALFGEPKIMNETLNEGSIVVSSSGSVYYASKQEHLIYELHVTRDFELHFGKIIKANAIKHPFGLITDECNHLYIVTRSMILVMFVKTFSTIRSVFSKASDLPITLERLNSTTYVYATIRKNAKDLPSYWTFNFLYFTEGDKMFFTTRNPAIDREESSNSNDTTMDGLAFPKLWPLSYTVPLTNNKTKKYIPFYSIATKPVSPTRKETSNQQEKKDSIDTNISSKDNEKLPIQNKSTLVPSFHSSDRNLSNKFDPNQNLIEHTKLNLLDRINTSIENKVQSEISSSQNLSSEFESLSKHTTQSVISNQELSSGIEREKNLSTHTDIDSQDNKSTRPLLPNSKFSDKTTNTDGILFTDDELQAFIEGRANLSKIQEMQIQIYLSKQSSLNRSVTSQFTTSTQLPTSINTSNEKMYPRDQDEKQYSNNDFTKLPMATMKILNDTMETQETLFSDDELRSYMEGRGNLSKEREAQIQAYLHRRSPSNTNIFSKYSTLSGKTYTVDELINHDRQNQHKTTEDIFLEKLYTDIKSNNKSSYSTHPFISDDELQSYVQGRSNLSLAQQAKIQAYLAEQSALNEIITSKNASSSTLTTSKYTTQKVESRDHDTQTSFSDDEIKSFLENRGNLSKIRQDHIRNYQSQRSSFYHSIFSTYPTSSITSANSYMSEDKYKYTDYQSKDTRLVGYTTKIPITKPNTYNSTLESNGIVFTDDDLQSFLEGRANLSQNQKAQIERYLSQPSSTNRTLTLKYPSTSTAKLPQQTITTNQFNNITHKDDQTKGQEIESVKPLPHSKDTTNPTIDKDTIVFSSDDLRYFLQGRANLSENQKTNIKTYLTKQMSHKSNTLQNFTSDKQRLSTLYTPNVDRTADTESLLFSEEDVKAYLEGRSNLSKTEELQMKAYLHKKSSSHSSTPSTYAITTKITDNAHSSDGNVHPEHDDDYTLMEEHRSQSRNHTRDSSSIAFSDDDLQSFLEGRANLSQKQKAQIERYLSQPSSTNRTLTLKYPSTSTDKLPQQTITTNQFNNITHKDDQTKGQEIESVKPLPHSKDTTNQTIDKDTIVFSSDDLRYFLQDRANLSENQKTNIKTYLTKQMSHKSNTLQNFTSDKQRLSTLYTPNVDRTADTESLLFSEEDVKAYLEGRSNLSKTEELQMKAYLHKKSSSHSSTPSTYAITTKITDNAHSSDGNVHPEHDDDYTLMEEHRSQSRNHTRDSSCIAFSDDDLQSFLEGRANLSQKQKAQIERYLSQPSSTNRTLTLKYPSTSTAKLPQQTITSKQTNNVIHQDNQTRGQEIESIKPLSPLKDTTNPTIDKDTIVFSSDDLRYFLQGRANLSEKQKIDIKTYLTKQMSHKSNTFQNLTSNTQHLSTLYTPNVDENDSSKPKDHRTKKPVFDADDFNRTAGTESVLFSEEDVKAYLEGRSNLSKTEERQMKAYLHKKSSLHFSTPSTDVITTKITGKVHSSDGYMYPEDEDDYTSMEQHHGQSHNHTRDSSSVVFSDDDLRSFREGRANLSQNQKAQIELYLSEPSWTNRTLTLKYPSSSKLPTKAYPTNGSKYYNYDATNTTLLSFFTKKPFAGTNDLNPTKDTAEITFSNDDLRSFLENRVNLSQIQKIQIDAYLMKQQSSNQTGSSIETMATTRTYVTDSLNDTVHGNDHKKGNTEFQDDFHFTSDVEGIKFSSDDLRSFLENRANLTASQKIQIEAYLRKSSSIHRYLFSKYSTSAKPSTGTHSYEKDDSSQIQDHGSKTFNRTLHIHGITFSDDDLRSFLQDRANLSKIQKVQIEVILNKQLLSNRSSLLNDSMIIATLPNIHPYTDDKINSHDETYLEKYQATIPSIDLNTLDTSTKSEDLLFSEDVLQAYLDRRRNFSSVEEAQIQACLSKRISSDRNIFSKYLSSTATPFKLLTHQDELQTISNKQINTSSSNSNELVHPESPSEDFHSTTNSAIISKSILNKLSSTKWHKHPSTTSSKHSHTAIDNRNNDFDDSIEKHRNISTDSNYKNNSSSDTLNKYSKISTSTKESFSDGNDKYYNKDNEVESFDSLREDSNLLIHSSTTSNSALKENLKTINSMENVNINYSTDRLLSSTSTYELHMNADSTPHVDYSDEKLILQSDTVTVNLSIFSTKFKSTKQPSFSSIFPLSKDVISKYHTRFPIDLSTRQRLTESRVASDDNNTNINAIPLVTHQLDKQFTVDQSQISSPNSLQYFTSSSRLQNLTRLQNQSSINDTSILQDTLAYELDKEIKISKDQLFDSNEPSTLSTLITNDIFIQMETSNPSKQNIKDGIEHENSSSVSVGVHVSSTLRPLSPFTISSTTLLSPHHSPLSSASHHSPAYSSTSSTHSNLFSSSKLFSDTNTAVRRRITTAMPSYSTNFPASTGILSSLHEHSTMQTSEEPTTFDRIQSTSITSSSLLITSEPYLAETISSASSVNTNEPSLIPTTTDPYRTSLYTSTMIDLPSTFQSTDSYSTDFESITTTLIPTTNFDSSSMLTFSDKMTIHSTLKTTNEENRLLFTSEISTQTDTMQFSSIIIHKIQEQSTPSEFVFTSSPLFYKSKIFTTLEHSTIDVTNPSTHVNSLLRTLTTYSPTSLTTRRYLTRKSKVSTEPTEPLSTKLSSTNIMTSLHPTTLQHDYELSTSTQISTDTSEWTTIESDPIIVLKPISFKNNSNTIIPSDLLNQLFTNLSTSTNSSTEKIIHVNLADLPPSSWNLSLNSNESIVLDVILPSSANSNGTTNLTFMNIEANSLSTSIVGAPVNIHVDRVQTKQFSLKVNATDDDRNSNRTKPSISDVVIGHVKSEQFELNLIKTDNMHVRVQQVDSATAELFFDSNFCTNESSLEINLNLSKNGTIRYGNRAPIRIGPVFTRVHMLKQSCELEQPLTLFFDICERQSPCLNSGTCVSLMPNYEDESYTHSEFGHIGYRCDCPLHASGEHCQFLDYPLGYCLNGGTLFQLYDRYNRSIEQCICPTGFRGEHCEENVDDCIRITCSDHGICEDGIDGYTCTCFEGFFGFNCERKHVQTVLLQAASRSFGVVAILLIASIAGLVVASDIHTYFTSRQKAHTMPHTISRVSSELFENSILLLGFSDAPIEMTDLSNMRTLKKPVSLKQRQTHRKTRRRPPVGYEQISRRKASKTTSRLSSRRYLTSSQFSQPII